MHPLLVRSRRLVVYLLAWIPIVALLAYIAWAAGGLSWKDAAEVLAPACGVFAFVCLSPWYVCRTRPLRPSNFASLAFAHAAAAGAAGLILAGAVWLAAYLLATPVPRLPVLFGMGVLLYLVSVGLHYAALAAAASSEAEKHAAEARMLAREAELQALRIQINPHFLFNSLHSISSLTTSDGARAREMCIRLADFLRSSLGLGKRDSIPLREELALARSYLEIERIRFGERLQVDQQIGDACLDCMVPALLLQPLVENAVKHGIAGTVGRRLDPARRPAATVPTFASPSRMPSIRKAPPAGAWASACPTCGAAWRCATAAMPRSRPAPHGGIYRVVLRFPCESPMASSSRA